MSNKSINKDSNTTTNLNHAGKVKEEEEEVDVSQEDPTMTRQLFDPTTRKFASVVVGHNARSRVSESACIDSKQEKIALPLPVHAPAQTNMKSAKHEGKGRQNSSSYNSHHSSYSGTNNKTTPVNFCNNCGRVGHIFQQCKQPITSIGIIAFRYKKDIERHTYGSEDAETRTSAFEYLMINRQHSLGYVEFMRGKYPVHNYDYLINIFNEMTIEEKDKIKVSTFSQLWRDLWGDHIGQQYRNEEKTSREKFNILKLGVDIGATKDRYSLDKLIESSNNLVQWSDTEWGFPKGRRNFQEKDLACAYREFEEETGYTKKHLYLIQNVMPFEEIFTGSNMKSYKHKYFLAYMEPESSQCVFPSEYHSSEVGEMKWLSYGECIERMRPYNVEKIDILKKVDTLLNEYAIHYAIQ